MLKGTIISVRVKLILKNLQNFFQKMIEVMIEMDLEIEIEVEEETILEVIETEVIEVKERIEMNHLIVHEREVKLLQNHLTNLELLEEVEEEINHLSSTQ